MRAPAEASFAWADPHTLRMVGLILLMCFVVLAYWSSFASMAQMWELSSYRHGYVIPIVSLYLLWRDRAAFVAERWQGSLIGVAALALCIWIWLIARATLVQAVEHIAIVAMLNAAVWAIAGLAAYRVVAFPLMFLAFALPIGNSIVPLLMEVTADVAASCLQALGIPVYRQGLLLTLPGGNFEVANVCSGFRYLNAGLALGVLVGHEVFVSWTRRAVYAVTVVVAFIVTNGLRAFLVMAIASATDMHLLTGADHIVFGWVLFLGVILALYFAAERFSDRVDHDT
jgi:exosortase A